MMSNKITVIGGINMDISATMTAPLALRDSIPGKVSMSSGGVARNIAHNLRLLGHDVHLVSVLGGDIFGRICHEQCTELGLDLSLTERVGDMRNGLYLCVNDPHGDMVTAVADMDIVARISPKFLSERIDAINQSAVVIADTNITADSLQYLLDHCTVPLMVDTVSTAKAPRIAQAMRQSTTHHLHTLKLNRQEALAMTECDTIESAAALLTTLGVQHVYITLGREGVYCSNGSQHEHFAAIPAQVVNTTGAGDAFVAGLAHALMQGVSWPDCTAWAQQAAHSALLTPMTVNPYIASLMLTSKCTMHNAQCTGRDGTPVPSASTKGNVECCPAG